MNISTKFTERLPFIEVLCNPAFSSRGASGLGYVHLRQPYVTFAGVRANTTPSLDGCDGTSRNRKRVVLPATKEFAKEAIHSIKSGKVIAVPTDTLYGFACDACIGVRVPNSDFIRIIARGSGSALALTSANLSGHRSSVCIKDFENLWGHCEYVYDGGELPMGRAGSTIVDLTSPGKYKIIRPGSAREETVEILERHFLVQEKIDDS